MAFPKDFIDTNDLTREQILAIETISDGISWMLFSLNVVFLLLAYIPMFPTLLRLREVDPDRTRIFQFPFTGPPEKVMLVLPVIELVRCVIATIGPQANDGSWKMVIGTVIALGEVVRIVSARGRDGEYTGLTPELAAERLAEEAQEQ